MQNWFLVNGVELKSEEKSNMMFPSGNIGLFY